MATNSIDNPAPSVIIDTYNPELWNITEKKTANSGSIVIPSNIATLDGINNYASYNNFYSNVYFNSLIQINNSYYINQTTDFALNFISLTLSIPLSSTYTFRNTIRNSTITLPVPNSSYNGCEITFKRTTGNFGNSLFSATSNLYFDGIFTNIILGGNLDYTCTIVCLPTNTSQSTFSWFILNKG